jgi:hypothetical protein
MRFAHDVESELESSLSARINKVWGRRVVVEKISKLSARKKAVANVLASLRIEQLRPSVQVVEGLHSYVAGNTTADKLIAEVMARHVSVRRG